ncbi:MAG TPA: hypothetical protein VLU25_11545 [Acidobacteriota bacterium]|nr:hypothetical protein [Acidobacteriota bacterium]
MATKTDTQNTATGQDSLIQLWCHHNSTLLQWPALVLLATLLLVAALVPEDPSALLKPSDWGIWHSWRTGFLGVVLLLAGWALFAESYTMGRARRIMDDLEIRSAANDIDLSAICHPRPGLSGVSILRWTMIIWAILLTSLGALLVFGLRFGVLLSFLFLICFVYVDRWNWRKTMKHTPEESLQSPEEDSPGDGKSIQLPSNHNTLVAEHGALRHEIRDNNRLSLQILGAVLIVNGAFVSYAFGQVQDDGLPNTGAPAILLILTTILTVLATVQNLNLELGTQAVAVYMREFLEPKSNDFRWERYLWIAQEKKRVNTFSRIIKYNRFLYYTITGLSVFAFCKLTLNLTDLWSGGLTGVLVAVGVLVIELIRRNFRRNHLPRLISICVGRDLRSSSSGRSLT